MKQTFCKIAWQRGLIVAILLGLATQSSFAQAPVINAKLLSEARVAWENYEKTARQWSFRVKYEGANTSRGKNAIATIGDCIVRSNSRCISIEQTDPNDDGPIPESKTRVAKVYGPDYEFAAQQSPGTPGWALTSVFDHAALQSAIQRKEVPSDRRTLRDEVESTYLLVAVSLDNLPVRLMIGHECCRTEKFDFLSAEPGALVEWRFTIAAAKRHVGMRRIERGRAVFDPKQRWVIQHYSIDNQNGVNGITNLQKTLIYRVEPNVIPVPQEMKTELLSDDKSYAYKNTAHFEQIPDATPLPDSRFTLSAYGIPEAARAQTHLGGVTLSEPGQPPPGPPTGRQTPLDDRPFACTSPWPSPGPR